MSQDDVLFDEDIAPDEEFLEWEDTDEGIEISLDCTKCEAWTPFTITWEELLAIGEGRKVKGFAQAPGEYRYRYTCPNCKSNYLSAGFNDRDALTEATSTIKFSLQEFAAWHSKALGREKSKGKQRRRDVVRQQPAQAPAAQPVAQPAPQPAPQAAPQPAPQAAPQQVQRTHQGGARRRKVQLPPEVRGQIRKQVQKYQRQLVQQGYGAEEIGAMRDEYAMKLLQQARAKYAPKRPAQQQMQPQQTNGQYRRARITDPATGRQRVVLVNAANQIVKYLS